MSWTPKAKIAFIGMVIGEVIIWHEFRVWQSLGIFIYTLFLVAWWEQ